jgi:predicted short-subunit dehydrogenase-like oxidoreductase (DUF2520 family)
MATKRQSDIGSVFVMGAGRVGSALVALLQRQGVALLGQWNRSPRPGHEGVACHSGAPFPELLAQADTVIVAVRDAAITPVASALQGHLSASARVLHCSGSIPAREALGPLVGKVAALGTLHPLVSIQSYEQALTCLPAAFFGVEGDDEAVAVCAAICKKLTTRWVRLDAKTLQTYHTAAVIAANHAVVLWAAARDLLVKAGIADPDLATRMLVPLVRSCLENTEALGLPQALTGPVRRGDSETIAHHLQQLEGTPRLRESYLADARLALELVASLGDAPGGVDLARLRRVLLLPDA